MTQEIEYRDGFVGNFRLLNFATGSYYCICGKCGKHFSGDKRAIRCLSCELDHVNSVMNNNLIKEQLGWYNPNSKRICYLDEKLHGDIKGSFNDYTVPVYIEK